MPLPTYRSVDNQQHAQKLAYALRDLLTSLHIGEDSRTRFEAVTAANKALVGYKTTNPSFSL